MHYNVNIVFKFPTETLGFGTNNVIDAILKIPNSFNRTIQRLDTMHLLDVVNIVGIELYTRLKWYGAPRNNSQRLNIGNVCTVIIVSSHTDILATHTTLLERENGGDVLLLYIYGEIGGQAWGGGEAAERQRKIGDMERRGRDGEVPMYCKNVDLVE